MSSIKHDRWNCTECGTNQGKNDMWFEGDICGVCKSQQDETKKKNDIDNILYRKLLAIGIDTPDNYNEIVDFCYNDICETADPDNWNDDDVAIAFRRWIEREK